MKVARIATVALVAVALTACADMQNNPKQTAGTVVGAGLGALAGSQVGSGKGQLAAVAVGALLGGLMGSEVGKSLDRADRVSAERTASNALESYPTGQTAAWRNPDNGNWGSTTPTRTYQNAQGQPCRDFETTVNIEGRSERVTGTACRQSDGTWSTVR